MTGSITWAVWLSSTQWRSAWKDANIKKVEDLALSQQGGHSLGRKKFKDFSRTLNSLFQTYSVDVSAKLRGF